MPDEKVGVVNDYFARIGVAGVDLVGSLRVGDTVRFRGHTTDFEQVVESMQIEHQQVEVAGPGDSVGIKVIDRVRPGDVVYRVT
ncbi:MAG TPA: translation elongation factor-like protein [Dehalococcoidia bacterium]|nr:translation elongation factor-like protein [Dehalococcoidia bacterium]